MKLDNNKGAALVELAIILPLLLTIVFGIFEYGRALFIINTLNNAAREGARRAAVSPSPININDFVKASIPFDQAELDNLVITTSNAPALGSGDPVKVTVTLPFVGLTGLVPVPASLKGEATMRYEL